MQAHKKSTKWRTKGFPLYDKIAILVDGIIATGRTAFRAGQVPHCDTPETLSGLSIPDSDEEESDKVFQ